MDTVKQNSMIILKNSTTYPFKQEGTMIRCCFCRNCFDDPRLFRSHMDSAHENIDRSLSIILRYDHRSSMMRVDITNLRCKCNPLVFSSLESLAEHLISEHHFKIDMNYSLGLVPLKLDGRHYECFICMKKFSGLTQLSRHAGSHFTRHICEFCGKHYETLSSLLNHLQTNHNPADAENPFKCRVCKRSFPTYDERKIHLSANKSCFVLKCRICNERFRTWDKRHDHLVEAHGKPRLTFACTDCDEKFARRTLLYFHFKAKHTKDLKCEFCDETFSMKRTLLEHVRRHTGERPYKCTVCSKTFLRSKTLKSHEITHDDSKKVACLACGQLYLNKSKLKYHIEKHHPNYSEMVADQI